MLAGPSHYWSEKYEFQVAPHIDLYMITLQNASSVAAKGTSSASVHHDNCGIPGSTEWKVSYGLTHHILPYLV